MCAPAWHSAAQHAQVSSKHFGGGSGEDEIFEAAEKQDAAERAEVEHEALTETHERAAVRSWTARIL